MSRDELRNMMVAVIVEAYKKEGLLLADTPKGDKDGKLSQAVYASIDNILDHPLIKQLYLGGDKVVELVRKVAIEALKSIGALPLAMKEISDYGEDSSCYSCYSTTVFKALLPFIGKQDTLEEILDLLKRIIKVSGNAETFLTIKGSATSLWTGSGTSSVPTEGTAILKMLRNTLIEQECPTKEEAAQAYIEDPNSDVVVRFFNGVEYKLKMIVKSPK
jgi:hypothetical protein